MLPQRYKSPSSKTAVENPSKVFGQPQSPGRKDSQALLEPPHPASSLSWYLGLEVMLTWFVWKGTSVGEIKLQSKGPHLGIVSHKGKNEREARSSWGLRSPAQSGRGKHLVAVSIITLGGSAGQAALCMLIVLPSRDKTTFRMWKRPCILHPSVLFAVDSETKSPCTTGDRQTYCHSLQHRMTAEVWKAMVRSLLAVIGIVACLQSLRRSSNTKQERQRRETPRRAHTGSTGPWGMG